MYDENRKFTKLVMFMAEKYYSNNLELNDAVSAFEDAVETSGNYYNGFQAPFLVCIWNKDYAELEDLLKNTSEKLYKAYRKEMEYDL